VPRVIRPGLRVDRYDVIGLAALVGVGAWQVVSGLAPRATSRRKASSSANTATRRLCGRASEPARTASGRTPNRSAPLASRYARAPLPRRGARLRT
jgi:hypothetical protein